MVTSVNTYGTSLYVPPATNPTSGPSAATVLGAYARAQTATSSNASVNVTLSAAARAALAAQTDSRTIDSVVTQARTVIDRRLSDAKVTTAMRNGEPTIDLSDIDRRTLYAVATNQGGKFSIEEQVVASLQMKATSDAALAPAAANMRVTGDYSSLYQVALANLETAGTEEKSTLAWAQAREALNEGLRQANAKPGVAPTGIEGDPVVAYLKATGGAVANPQTRPIDKVAADVRSVLDKQYAAAQEAGESLSPSEGDIDFARFDNRSLAAITLNAGALFSEHEVAQATAEIRDRNRNSVTTAFSDSQASGDGSDFARNLIAQYASMSSEERDAVGWTPALYDKMIANQTLSAQIASMFNADGSVATPVSLLDYL